MSIIKLAVHSNIFNCDFEFNRRINIIVGDSGVGKTTLVDLILSEEAGVKIEATLPLFIADRLSWEAILKSQENSIIIIDDKSIVESNLFAALVSKVLVQSNLYLVIIDRARMPYMSMISHNMRVIYEMCYDKTLVNHYLREITEETISSINETSFFK